MGDLWFSPLAPTVIFLVGAFVVRSAPKKFPAGLVTTLLVFVVLISRILLRGTYPELSALTVFSGWSANGALTIRVDGLSMAFLFIPVFLLLGVFWAKQVAEQVMLLLLGGASCLVFIAANGISFSYALLVFDVVGCIFWLQRSQPNLAIIRLFLTVLTTGILMLSGLSETADVAGNLLAFALWLRVGLLPFAEISYLREEALSGGEMMVWLALSTAVGVYVAARFLAVPLPQFVTILMVLIVLLNAWLAWIQEVDHIRLKLLRMILIQPSLALLIAPIEAGVSITLGVVYTFGLATLWLTPQLGRPNLLERHWLWIYAAPLLATLSLMSFPATLGWLASDRIYTDLLLTDQLAVVAAVLLAEGIAFSILYPYWRWLLQRLDRNDRALSAALVLAVPFLIPWLGSITFSVVTNVELSGAVAEASPSTWVIVALVWLLALGFGVGRQAMLTWLGLTPQSMQSFLSLTWLWPVAGHGADRFSRGVLRLRATLEGAHYLAWAFLIGLAGILVVVLS